MAFLEDAGLLGAEPFGNAPAGNVTGDTLGRSRSFAARSASIDDPGNEKARLRGRAWVHYPYAEFWHTPKMRDVQYQRLSYG
jgi:hypothetical protein